MKIEFQVSESVKSKMKEALLKFGDYEIGGILIGKKLAEQSFEIIDISISDEDKRFSISSFIRGTKKSERLLKRHFRKKTGYYLGEWHSHPKFSLNPSQNDVLTMVGILNDPDYGVQFAVLIITHLVRNNELAYKGYLFHKDLDRAIELKET